MILRYYTEYFYFSVVLIKLIEKNKTIIKSEPCFNVSLVKSLIRGMYCFCYYSDLRLMWNITLYFDMDVPQSVLLPGVLLWHLHLLGNYMRCTKMVREDFISSENIIPKYFEVFWFMPTCRPSRRANKKRYQNPPNSNKILNFKEFFFK